MRSSLAELRKDWTHHWPNGDTSRSKKSGISKCTANRRRANIAKTRGLLDSRNAVDLTSFPNVKTASLLILSSFSLFAYGVVVFGLWIPSHREHFISEGFPPSLWVDIKEPFAAHGIRARYSMALHLSGSFNAAKQALTVVSYLTVRNRLQHTRQPGSAHRDHSLSGIEAKQKDQIQLHPEDGPLL
jgi:hypothetical protein